MLGTVILEKYNTDQRQEIAKALELLIYDNSEDWATAGIYCYWDYYTKEILYIGLAVDIVVRFKQHNGIIVSDPNSCKFCQINSYFQEKKYLGFTLMLQSALSQPITHRVKRRYSKSFDEKELSLILGEEGSKEIKRMEGLLIESHKQNFGKYPLWNEIGGAIEGQSLAKLSHIQILNLLTNRQINNFVASVSLLELANTSCYRFYETYLHGARISPTPFDRFFELHKKLTGLDILGEIRSSGYLEKELNL